MAPAVWKNGHEAGMKMAAEKKSHASHCPRATERARASSGSREKEQYIILNKFSFWQFERTPRVREEERKLLLLLLLACIVVCAT
jgi:hypothetical protein